MRNDYRLCRVLLATGALLIAVGSTSAVASADQTATYNMIRPSLALVISGSGKRESFGTAFCIGSHDGVAYLLTNKHVVGNDPNPQVIMSADPSSLLHGTPVRIALVDAVVLAVRETACSPLTLSGSPPAVGTDVGIAGFPAFQLALSNGSLQNLSPSFHEGAVNAVTSSGSWIEYDAQTDRGNSGSPLFDMQTGVVYGMVTIVSTGTTGALQNNLAIPISSISTFLDNAHANVAYAPNTNSSAAPSFTGGPAPSGSLAASVDVHCGSGAATGLFKQLNKAFSELSANDYVAATTDARSVIETASTCVIVTPDACQGVDSAPCNDSPHALIEGVQLSSQQILRIATARTNGDAINALRNEVTTAVDLCASPNILSPSQPYQAIRSFISGTIATVSKMNHVRDVSGTLDVGAVRACATKIGITF
jgi:S1-C subfamily serine protease